MSRNGHVQITTSDMIVAPREGRVSRNVSAIMFFKCNSVAPREGRVSRNLSISVTFSKLFVAPREGRVSRNALTYLIR